MQKTQPSKSGWVMISFWSFVLDSDYPVRGQTHAEPAIIPLAVNALTLLMKHLMAKSRIGVFQSHCFLSFYILPRKSEKRIGLSNFIFSSEGDAGNEHETNVHRAALVGENDPTIPPRVGDVAGGKKLHYLHHVGVIDGTDLRDHFHTEGNGSYKPNSARSSSSRWAT
jgi:hypothetical protein